MRIAWLTDIHLEHASSAAVADLIEQVRASLADAVLIGGDIATASDLESWLRRLAGELARPIYFVLGNHDYYGGSIGEVRERVRSICAELPSLHYLSSMGVVPIGERTALIGHDGWGDGGYGNAATTTVMLNDFLLIRELLQPRRTNLLAELSRLGIEAGEHLEARAREAITRFEQTIVLTHVPPFVEAAWHEGKPSDSDWAPFFACRAAGEALLKVLAARPDRRMTVYCGHTHGGGVHDALPNLRVVTGPASYGEPVVQQILEIR